MSYILDALKKADEARQRTTGPSLDRVRAPRHEARRRWPWIVATAALVAVNGAVVIQVLRPGADIVAGPGAGAIKGGDTKGVTPAPERPRDAAITAPRAATATSEPARRPSPAAVREQSVAVPATRSDAARSASPTPTAPGGDERRASPATRPAPVQPAPPTPPAVASPSPAIASPGALPGAIIAPPAVPPAAVPRPAAVMPAVPAPRVLPVERAVAARPPVEGASTGDDVLSKLKLTVHVFAENPADRLVFIDGRKYVQGDRIEGKALLEEITHDGAVVSFDGRRSLLRP